MPITVKHTKPSGYVVFRANGADGIKLNDATIGANSINEVVQSMSIAEVIWSVSGTNTWSINRGSNTVVTLGGSGHHDYQAAGMKVEEDSAQLTSNCNVTISGGTGTILVKLHKVSGE